MTGGEYTLTCANPYLYTWRNRILNKDFPSFMVLGESNDEQRRMSLGNLPGAIYSLVNVELIYRFGQSARKLH